MARVQQKEHSEFESLIPTMMAPDIDWLHCRASLCKVNLFSSEKLKSDKERKLVCFVDVSSLNAKERGQNSKPSTSESSDMEPIGGFDLEEKEIVIIKDENKNSANTEGAVCFFKQGRCEKGNVVNWLSCDLQKYAAGFQHALTPANFPQKSNPSDSAAETVSQDSSTSTFNCSGA
ncbi:Hypothetical predicted protein [Podarcis lilfordi]|uniref:Uncharacterized protein n=1 Tax=Podarcis lilfordi TaxID=74358 RepID=A0AA35LK46_9SAUR|nr:Hypothetical predicted protein [Podarcis lilfordi]